jgi:cytochrome c oxidase subunit 3
MSTQLADSEDQHGHHHGSPFIQHHYDNAQHQFDSGKLGIWAFLAQEILFFSALFVAYMLYRAYHPEIFAYAHKYLDTTMGAINTGVLIVSSLTAAWAVRCAQKNQQTGLKLCLLVTILCSFGFLGIKYIEYSHKFHVGTLWGAKFQPHEAPDGSPLAPEGKETAKPGPPAAGHGTTGAPGGAAAAAHTAGQTASGNTPPLGTAGSPGGAVPGSDRVKTDAAGHGHAASGPPPPNTGMFFTIYFAMTGLHGIHVLVGAIIFIWLLIRAMKGHFTPEYYGPIDYAALYWHLVDLIWIYLFPLLYLIH